VLLRMAGLAHRRPVPLLLVTLVLAAVSLFFGASAAERLDPLGFEDPASESARADAELAARGWLEEDLVVLVDGALASAADVARVVETDPGVERVVVTPRSADGSAYVVASFAPSSNREKQDIADRIEADLAGQDGIAVGGQAPSFAQLNETIQTDLIRAELFAFPVLFVLALLMFRSLVAATLPLVVGALSVIATLFLLRVLGEIIGISVLSLNLVTALGFGLAIDYSLFMVARYREELARHGPGAAALRATMATAGRTVFFSSLTVAAALASLLVFPQQFLYSIAIGGVLVSLLAAAVSLLVLPALLALIGVRIDAIAPKWLQRRAAEDAQPITAGRWYRTARFVQRRPLVIAVASSVVLIVLALPALGLRFTAVDASVLPPDTGARQVYEALEADGALPAAAPLTVYVSDLAAADDLAEQARALPDATVAAPPSELPGGGAVVRIQSQEPVFGDRSQALVDAVRALPVEGEVLVTGPTAEFVDLQASMISHLPLVSLIIVLSTIVAVFLMTGSIVLGIKALVMNFLTLGAVFGVLVVVFQQGLFESLLGYTSQGALESTIPLILFAGVFGLSTDYGVFLLARIKEARDEGLSDTEAVAMGQARTGRLITSAALLFCVAVGAFATSHIVGIKEMTLGIAFGVVLDATIVRIYLVPALMQLLSSWNWWSPAPLARLHRRIGLSEGVNPTDRDSVSAPPAR
jgi:uncharacterized membrane protein YdfJ with MMPL/SSD domain